MATVMQEACELVQRLRRAPEMQSNAAVSAREQMIEALRSMKPHDYEEHYVARRKRVHELSVQVAKLGIIKAEFVKEDFATYLMALMPLLNWDLGVLTKLVIHFQLFGGTIMELGTERHRKWIEMANTGAIIGGFAMTEIGHGSNVQAIETRADYEKESDSFILNSPTPTSIKFMIGNVGVHGEVVVLMAQLYIAGERKGVHAFVVPVRSLVDGEVVKGVDLGDVGLKSSWNEVDNAWIRFKDLKIPRENLLNRLADVTADGQYVSSLTSPSRLFAATMAQLTVGRIGYIGAPLLGVETALWTALRYAHQRLQFSPSAGSPETPIIQYSTHYSMLMNTMAKMIALQFGLNDIIHRLPTANNNPDLVPEYHATISGLKAYVCEWAYIQLGHLRVMCGGGGIILANGIGQLHNFFDVFQTAEGDRIVLYQQLGKYLVSETAKKFRGFQGLFTFGLEIISQNLVAMNPLLSVAESNAEPNISSHGFIMKALEIRQKATIRDVISRIQNFTTAPTPLSPAQAWNESLPQIIKACDAFLELYIFQRCCAQVNQFDVDLPPSRPATSLAPTKLATDMARDCLRTVVTVTGLGFIKDDLQFFARNNLFSSSRCNSIEEVWMIHCKRLVERHVELLLMSGGIVPEFIKAPHGQKDGNYVEHLMAAMKPSQAKL
jgi:acyl-CoA oxidase